MNLKYIVLLFFIVFFQNSLQAKITITDISGVSGYEYVYMSKPKVNYLIISGYHAYDCKGEDRSSKYCNLPSIDLEDEISIYFKSSKNSSTAFLKHNKGKLIKKATSADEGFVVRIKWLDLCEALDHDNFIRGCLSFSEGLSLTTNPSSKDKNDSLRFSIVYRDKYAESVTDWIFDSLVSIFSLPYRLLDSLNPLPEN